MEREIIDRRALKEKSEDTGIPFSNLLAGYVLEELLYLIADSDFAPYLWLKNSEILGLEQYKKKNLLTLEFSYVTDESTGKAQALVPGQELSQKMGYVMLASILKKEKTPEIKWKGRAAFDGAKVELELAGEFDELTVPLHVCVEKMEGEERMPTRKEFIPFMREKQAIGYLEYPPENMLTDRLFLMLRDLELIPEMNSYEQVYEILTSEEIDGRHIKEQLEKQCQKEGLPLEESRGKEILSYKTYPHMRKRFEKYLRSQGKKEPGWDEVMDVICAFLPRIWSAICEDTIFFGDWMPKLGRFLD
ncbi:MAG: hypothetical protein PUB98_05625 [Clostridiales bacterium]|nr:hypothetical protein [Clostridiales bacterium]